MSNNGCNSNPILAIDLPAEEDRADDGATNAKEHQGTTQQESSLTTTKQQAASVPLQPLPEQLPLKVSSIEDEERYIRQKALSSNTFVTFLFNVYVAIKLFVLFLLCRYEALAGILLTVGTTLLVYFSSTERAYGVTDDQHSISGATMPWDILSFVLVLPMSRLAVLSFRRRESVCT